MTTPPDEVAEALAWLDDCDVDIAESRAKLGRSTDVLDRCERCVKSIRARLTPPTPIADSERVEAINGLQEADRLLNELGSIVQGSWAHEKITDAIAALSPKAAVSAPINKGNKLGAEEVNLFPDGTRDNCTYSDVEEALRDLGSSPFANGKWLTLPERIRSLSQSSPALDVAKLAEIIHYPDCWDTAAYPTITDALVEILGSYFQCNEDHCPRAVAITGKGGAE